MDATANNEDGKLVTLTPTEWWKAPAKKTVTPATTDKWQMPGMGLIEQPTVQQPTKPPPLTPEFGAIPGMEMPVKAAEELKAEQPKWEDEEGWLKDNIADPLYLGGATFVHGQKVAFTSILPALLTEPIPYPQMQKATEPVGGFIPGSPEWYAAATFKPEDIEQRQEEIEGIKEAEVKHFLQLTAEMDDWMRKRPELTPNPEYLKNPFENTDLFKDPGYYAYSFTHSLVYSLSVMATIVSVSAVATPAVGVPVGLLVAGAPEAASMTEELMKMGVPFDDAIKWGSLYGLAAGGVETVSDLPLLGILFKPLQGITKPMWDTILRGTANRIVKKIATGIVVTQIEGLEEAITQAAHNAIIKHYDETQSITEGMSHSYIQGVIASLPFGGIGGYASHNTFYDRLPPEIRRRYDELIADYQKAGLTLEQAQVQAANEIAKTPEGEGQIAQAVEAAQEEYWETVTGVEPTITEAPTVAMAEWETVSGKPEIIKPTALELRKWKDMGFTSEDIASLSKMSPELRELTAHQARIAGFRDVSSEAIDDYLQKALKLAQSRHNAKAIESLQSAIEYNDSGILQNALLDSEQGLGYLHFDELATLRDVQKVTEEALAIPEVVTPRVTEVTPKVTKPTVEPEALFIPEKLPTTPPPLTPEGTILGRSDNEWGGFMADLQDAGTVADIASRNDMVRKWANNLPGLRELFKILNPSVVANTPAEKSTIVRATLRDEGYQKTQGVISYLNEIGTQEEIFGGLDSKGFIKEGKLKGQTVGDIAQSRAKWETKLTDEQRFWLARAKTIETASAEFLLRNDIDIKLLKLEEGGQFATRRVWGKTLSDNTVIDVAYVGAGPGRPGSRLPTEKHRYFKTEAEAIEARYHYIPYEEALYLKVSGAYNRVADKKMADWLLTKVTWRTTGAPEELVLAAESARVKMRHSQMLLAGLNRAVRGERLPDVTIRAIATSYPAQAQALKDLIPRLQAAKPSAEEINSLTNTAKGLIDTNKMMYWKAVNARVKARERAMVAGYEEAQIPAPAFSGKILTGPEAKETARTLRESFEPSFSKALGEINKANAVARYFMLAGDFSPFTIQLIFLLGENPKIYGKAFGGAVRAMVNPKFQSKFLSKHKATIDRHPNLLISKGGATEFTEAMARGGWLSGKTSFRPEAETYWKSLALFLPRAVGKVGGTVLTPFQRVFETSLDAAGIYMAEAYDHLCTTPERTADVDQFINEFRGLTSSARIGISGKQRQLETFTLLAPRYNRAIAGLLFDLSRGNIRGHLARKSLIKGISALCAIAVAISIARGEDEEEIIEHFNPNSSKFFTWDVAGQKIGPGSKVRSLIKLVAQSSSDPDELLEFSMDNPALRFVRGNLAPVIGSSVDLITGRSYIGDPTRDGMLSFSKEILAGNLLPIWVQSVLMEGGDVKGRTWRGFAEFFGGRAYPEPLWDEVRKLRDKYAKQDLNMKYEDLNRAQIDKLKENHPDLDDLEERARLEQAERGNEFELGFYEIRKEAIAERDTALDEAATLLLAGSISKYDYDKERGYVRPYYSGGMSTLYQMRDRLDPKAIKDIEEWLSENQKPEDKAMDEYQEHRASLIEKADLPRDWDEIEAKCDTFLKKYPKKIQDYIKDNLSRWINDLPENAKKIELMRLHGIEDETWWDDYRGTETAGPTEWWEAGPSEGTTQGPTQWWLARP